MVQMFSEFSMVESFLDVHDEDHLYERIERITHDLGFEQFAIGHHVDLVGPPAAAIRLTNYHADWIDQALSERFYLEDPIHKASMKTGRVFRWSNVPNMIRLTLRQQRILDIAAGYGLREGYTVPVHVPGDYRGTCSFATSSNDRIVPNALALAHSAGGFAFEAAREIMRLRHGLDSLADPMPVLTERQRDCVVLIGRGKSDAEIGDLLGISKRTAHEHVENARKAYGYAQRVYLVVRALFDGQIGWHEILRS